MIPNNQLDPKALGQLLIMQSYLSNLPDKSTIFSFVCKGLQDIPGVKRTEFKETLAHDFGIEPCNKSYAITLGDSHYGFLVLEISEISTFEPYEPYIENFIFMIGVVLEERTQRKINEAHQQELEIKIAERTRDLNLEKEKLVESERRFSDLMKNVNLLSVMLDLKGNIIYVNNFLLELTKYNSQEILGKNWFDLFLPPELAPSIKSIFRKATEGQEFVLNYENEIIAKTGEKLIIAWNNTLLFNAEKKIIGAASIGENITERKKSELLLKEKSEEIEAQNEELFQTNLELSKAKEIIEESEERFRIITLSTPDYITVQDSDLVYTMVVNPQMGLTQKDMLGKTDFDFLNKEDAQKLLEIKKNVLENRKPHQLVIPLQNKMGEYEYFEGTYIPWLGAHQKINGIIGYLKNITERKRMVDLLKIAKNKAEESDKLKTAFLQNMSHEIRTPMNAIMGFSDLLISNFDNKDKLNKFSHIISQRCKDLLEIINDILDISRIESGQLTVNSEEVLLPELFDEIITFFTEYQSRFDKNHIALILNAPFLPSDEIIKTDRVKLKQIFINLLTNAFKFTEQGKIELGCKYNQQQFQFYVSDTGIGIPKEKQEIIFERFIQLNQANKRNIGGTGLGLSIVKGLIKLMNGKITLDSEPGVGSTFTFEIPFESKIKQIKSPNSDQHKTLFDFNNKSILIVEDDLYNAEYLKEILSEAGCEIYYAENGEQSVELALNKNIDLVLMDIRLPDMSGYEAVKRIKEFKPDLIIIAQTAYAAQDEYLKAINEGCTDYVSKPTRREKLFEVLNKYLYY